MAKEYPSAELTPEKLFEAYKCCLKRKSNTRQAMEFEFNREKNLRELYNELVDGTYEIGKSICFIVSDPKYREVWAGSFRDRIVHHLIYNAIFERFHNRFIFDTYSCIPERGTLRGAKRAMHFSRSITQNFTKKAYFLKMDIKNYFVTIDKHILFNELIKYVHEPWLIELIQKVLFHDPRQNVYLKSPKRLYEKLPPYKSLFNSPKDKGLPIGNLTSQFFSNVYLNPLDQYIKHELKCKRYIRYVDDMLLIHEDPGFLNYAYAKINRFLIDNLAMELNHKKKNINTLERSFDFLGLVIDRNHVYLRKRTTNKCKQLITKWQNDKNRTEREVLEDFRNSINSYYGLLRHVDGYRIRKDIAKMINSEKIKPDKNYTKMKIA